jgi:alpha-tubulin suppressor-like RCC1 family protein
MFGWTRVPRRSTRLSAVGLLALSLATASVTAAGPASAAGSPTRLSLHAAPSTVRVGAPLTVSGASSQKVAGTTAVLQRLVGHAWKPLAHQKTGSLGRYTFTLRAPAKGTRWRLRVTTAGSRTAKEGTSASVAITVTKAVYTVTATASATTPLVVQGSVKPKAKGVVVLQQLKGKAWVALAQARLTTASAYTIRTTRPAGSYRLRVVSPFSAKIAAGTSKALTVVVPPASTPAPPVVVPVPLSVATTALPSAMVTRPYTQTVTASSGSAPYTWTASGLPTGLSISSGGVISGSPATVGASSVSLTVTDASGHTATATLPLTVAVLSGTVFAWGPNSSGELGDTTTTDSATPVAVVNLTQVTATASGSHANYAVRSDGTAWAWGSNYWGQLGLGNNTDVHVPTQIPGLTGVVAMAAAGFAAYALKSDGTVWAWGDNADGDLGDGTMTERKSPVQVSGLSSVTALAASAQTAFALESGGTVWSWGSNANGSLGTGAPVPYSTTPVAVSHLTTAKAISAGMEDGYALLADGTVDVWGNNDYGQLGNNGLTVSDETPFPVPGLTNVTAIAGGARSAYALHTNGTMSAWGENIGGELGDGNTTFEPVPVPVLSPSGISQLGVHGYTMSVLLADGTVQAWGDNGFLELGTGPGASATTPTALPSLHHVFALSSGCNGLDGLAIVTPT